MSKAPAFQFYVNDWLSSTPITLMTPAEEGAYIRLLAYMWNDPDCSLPDDDNTLISLSRLTKKDRGSIFSVKKCLNPHPELENKLTNLRLYQEKIKQVLFKEKCKEYGKIGNKKRWSKGNNEDGVGDGVGDKYLSGRHRSSSSSSSSNKDIKDIVGSLKPTVLIDPNADRLSNLLFEETIKNNPQSRLQGLTQKEREIKCLRWAKDIDLLIRKDGKEPSVVEEVIRWCQQDGFWRSNILSGQKLREKWDTLTAQMERRKGGEKYGADRPVVGHGKVKGEIDYSQFSQD